MAFADDFRAIVTPRLRRLIHVQGFFVAAGVATYGEAHMTIYVEAYYLGAGVLPDPVRDDLTDWIASQLLSEIVAAEPVVERYAAEAGAIFDESDRYFAAWAASQAADAAGPALAAADSPLTIPANSPTAADPDSRDAR